MKFSYYNTGSKIILLLMCLGPFLGMSVWSMWLGPGFLKFVSAILFVLFLVFIHKCLFVDVTINAAGITYKSLLKTKHMDWSEVKDILIVVRERRSSPDFYRLNEWLEEGKKGKNYFILFRTTAEIPQDPMFVFTSPTGEDYISLQYRNKVKDAIYTYYYSE